MAAGRGWKKGSTDDVAVWRDQLQKNWSHLRSGVCYGGSGFIGHKSYTAQAAPRSNWMPEERQTRFHEEYVKNLQNDSLFWGTWINNMFDYGSARRPYGINGEGLVTIDRRERKAHTTYTGLCGTNGSRRCISSTSGAACATATGRRSASIRRSERLRCSWARTPWR